MPGMMDTILDLGINASVAKGIAARTANEPFALDLYRRFIQMYGNVVLGVEDSKFNGLVRHRVEDRGVERATDLPAADLLELVGRFKAIVEEASGETVPDDPWDQLMRSIQAVFESWNTRRAVAYRDYHDIPHDLGTAVNVMSMVYGNMGENSATGVLFTRSPATGEKAMYGEYLVNAQGEDVVSGVATPRKIDALGADMPRIFEELNEAAQTLERHYRDVQDVEFTVEQGRLYILQTRTGKRSAGAAIKIAVDMVTEGLIEPDEAVLRVEPDQVYHMLLPRFDDAAKAGAIDDGKLLTRGLNASPGACSGKVVFDSDEAAALKEQGEDVVLVRAETSAEDVHGMVASVGVLTSRGGATSHAAVVARGIGKPCVAGAEDIDVDVERGVFRCGDVEVRQGESISLDGGTGEVFLGTIDTVMPSALEDDELRVLLRWADERRKLGVWANADTPEDSALARSMGAEGIGLCRTEHMFFEPDRLDIVRKMILAAHRSSRQQNNDADRQRYLDSLSRLEKIQTADFEGIFAAMDGLPVVIRLLDPPLHEFLPGHAELADTVEELRHMGASDELAEAQAMLDAANDLREANPMLGLRGCRVGIQYPEIYQMQTRAIVHAAHNAAADGVDARPEIMLPLVSHGNEMSRLRALLEETRRQLGSTARYKIGAMIETPRAALTADEIAAHAEFFSFGTNDLTQTTYAFSRDDAEGKFLMDYVDEGVLPKDPFQVLDRDGVGKSSSRWRRSWVGRHAPTLASASAASTAAIRPASSSSTRSASTT